MKFADCAIFILWAMFAHALAERKRFDGLYHAERHSENKRQQEVIEKGEPK